MVSSKEPCLQFLPTSGRTRFLSAHPVLKDAGERGGCSVLKSRFPRWATVNPNRVLKKQIPQLSPGRSATRAVCFTSLTAVCHVCFEITKRDREKGFREQIPESLNPMPSHPPRLCGSVLGLHPVSLGRKSPSSGGAPSLGQAGPAPVHSSS